MYMYMYMNMYDSATIDKKDIYEAGILVGKILTFAIGGSPILMMMMGGFT